MNQVVAPSKVTVVVPTYGHEQFIAQCLDSLLNQSQHPAEIIVINDGSPDRTDEVIAPYLPFIRYYPQSNHGLAATLNRGLSMVESDYVMFLGSDDWLCPTALEDLAQILDAHPDVGVVHANRWKVDQHGAELENRDIPWHGRYDAMPSLSERNYIYSPAIMLRIRARSNVGFIPDFPYCRDWAAFMILALQGWKFYGMAQPLGYYRRHANNTTHARHSNAILEDELAMLQWILQRQDVPPTIRATIVQNIALRLRSLGWLSLESGDKAVARNTFIRMLHLGNRDWNTLLGLVASHSPHFLYESLQHVKQHVSR